MSGLEKIRSAMESKAVRIGAATSIAIGSLSLAACAESEPRVVEPTPSSEVSQPNPETTQPSRESAFSGIPSVEELEISSELSPEQVGEEVVNLLSDWVSAGANIENVDLRYEGDNPELTQDEFVQKIVDSAAPVFAEALYGQDWQNPVFSENIASLKRIHFSSVMLYFSTQSSDLPSPYQREESLVGVEDVTKSEENLLMTLLVDYSDNSQELGLDTTVSGLKESIQVSFGELNGRLVLTEPFVVQSR